MGKVYIKTFGCQMNVHDSEKMLGIMKREGYSITNNLAESDLIIFNTCSIRHKAEQKFFSELGRMKALKRGKPGLKIAVAGCIAQQQGESILKRAPYVDFVFGPQNIYLLPQLLNGDIRVAKDDNPQIAETDLPLLRNSQGRAWVSIMFGCNNFCSYCVVPYTRGRERSRPSQNILLEIEELAGAGYKEITLLGQNVNSYMSDTNFPGLLKKISNVKEIQRIRFVTSHPRDLSDELISVMKDMDKVCEHIHLPLQSASDRILKLMNRGYSYDEYSRKIEALRDKIGGISITTDIIAGFPGETEDDHSLTVKALEETEFDGIFAFKFSPRPGTKAAGMENQVPEAARTRRLSEILVTQDAITSKLNRDLENSVQEILAEGPSDSDSSMLTGRTRGNKIVNFKGNVSCVGRMTHVRIVRASRHSLTGEPL